MLLMTGWLFASSIMDVKFRRIPVWMLVLGGVLTMMAVLHQENAWFEVLRGMLPGVMLLLIAFVTKKAGYGDGIVLSCLGIVLGSEKSLLLLGLSLFLVSFFALILLALRRVRRNTEIPFLPFLAVAWLIVMNL